MGLIIIRIFECKASWNVRRWWMEQAKYLALDLQDNILAVPVLLIWSFVLVIWMANIFGLAF